ncbi:MAG: aldo/keto reductase [bacterium]|nr:aldo/keto reductase [bacterium]
METIILNTGVSMPSIGLGTWKSEPKKVGQAVEYALLEAGYRHIDCAAIYLNEKEIGAAFKKVFASGKMKREDVFVTSKLWNTEHAKEDVVMACKKTLVDLRLDYLDLYLMHWGVATPPKEGSIQSNARGEPLDASGSLITAKVPVRETWEAMEELVNAGLVRAIGVANFTAPMLIDLLSYAHIPPAMNQIELHPYNQQSRLVKFCHARNITVTAYSPLGAPGKVRAQNGQLIIDDEVISVIANKYKKSSVQVLIRWGIQRKTIVIPKSVTPERIKSNMDVFDFALSQEDMNVIARLDKKQRYVDPAEWWKIPYFD